MSGAVLYRLLDREPETLAASGLGHFDDDYAVNIISCIDIDGGRKWPVTAILEGAFQETYIKSVSMPDTVTDIGCGAFMGCGALVSAKLSDNLTAIKAQTFRDYGSLASIDIPPLVASIEQYAFENCPLTSVDIPASVSNIHVRAFDGCKLLNKLNVAHDNLSLTSVDGVLYDKAITKLLLCPPAKVSLTIPATLIAIREEALRGCRKLTSITSLALVPPKIEFTRMSWLRLVGKEGPAVGKCFDPAILENIPLHVPAASVDLYRQNPSWGRFANILPIE